MHLGPMSKLQEVHEGKKKGSLNLKVIVIWIKQEQ